MFFLKINVKYFTLLDLLHNNVSLRGGTVN